jgi:hypothetical protein
MTSPHDAPKAGTREHFLQVTTLRRWGTIQEYVDLCRAQGYFTEAFYRKATAHMERTHVRRMLRQVTDGRGWPTLANIVRPGPDGRPERVFMQEELFGPEEYRQVVAYHYGLVECKKFLLRHLRQCFNCHFLTCHVSFLAWFINNIKRMRGRRVSWIWS